MIFNKEVIELNMEDLKIIHDKILLQKYDSDVNIYDKQEECLYAMNISDYWLDERQSVLFILEKFLMMICKENEKFKDREEAIDFISDNLLQILRDLEEVLLIASSGDRIEVINSWQLFIGLEEFLYDRKHFKEYLKENNIKS